MTQPQPDPPPAGTQLWVAGEYAARSDFFAGLYDRFPWVAGIVLAVVGFRLARR